MPRGIPVDAKTRALILRLHGEGVSRNEIARQCGASTFVVSKVVAAAGLSFERKSIETATRARTADLASERALLAAEMLEVARDQIKRTRQPYLVYAFGGKDNDYNEQTLTEPPAEAVRNMMTTAGIAFDKATRLIEREEDPGLGTVRSLIGVVAERWGLKDG